MSTRTEPRPADEPQEGEERAGNRQGGSRRRSVARLAAVQALYQLELNRGADPEAVVREFVRHRFGHEIDGDRYGEADPALFSDVVRGVAADLERLDSTISFGAYRGLAAPAARFRLRAILRAGDL